MEVIAMMTAKLITSNGSQAVLLPDSCRFEGDEQVYYEAEMPKDGHTVRIVAARQDQMGMTAAATLSMKLIERYRPHYLIMPGITAGAGEEKAEDQLYGDVILANAVWDYSIGKFVPPEQAEIVFGDVGFLPRPSFIHIANKLMPYFEAAVASDENQCHIHIGHIASGSTVVANRNILEKQVQSQSLTTRGLDMESYGVAYAATHCTDPKPYPIIAKSICDFADSNKSDDFQKFAAYTSCEFTKLLFCHFRK
jgi:nucleoside phosphorylase